MSNRDNNELSEIKDQLTQINQVMNISASTFKIIYEAKNLRSLFLYAGIFSVLVPLMYQILLWVYGASRLIPDSLKILFYCVIGALWGILVTMRTIKTFTAFKRLHPKMTILGMIKQLLCTKMWIAVIPILLIAAAIALYYSYAFSIATYISAGAIVVGLIVNIIGVMINQKAYSFCGYWLIIVALINIIILSFPAHIVYGILFAPACFLFFITAHTLSKPNRSKDELN